MVVSNTPGYVLAAAAVLVALGGIAARSDAPFAVVGAPAMMRSTYDRLLDTVTHLRLDRLDRGVRAYHLEHGTVPRTLEDLAKEGLIDRRFLRDPAERPFHYALTENGYLLSAVDDQGRKSGALIERVLPPERP
jgi:hypothetical protein